MSSIARLTPVYPMPTGIDQLGMPSFGPLPGGVPNPPNAWREAQELQMVRELNARANASPDAIRFTEYLADTGGLDLWLEMARQYRRRTGLLRGWVGTGLMLAGIGTATVRTQLAKHSYDRMRPYQVDPSIRTIGRLPGDASYPSGHTSAAYAAATVLGHLWPARAWEFNWWARQVGLSRVHAGVHFPSDVEMGARLGMRDGMLVASVLR